MEEKCPLPCFHLAWRKCLAFTYERKLHVKFSVTELTHTNETEAMEIFYYNFNYIQNKHNKLTSYKTGSRFVYVGGDPSNIPEKAKITKKDRKRKRQPSSALTAYKLDT